MSEPVTVKILDREFTVGCEPNERQGLLAAAALLDGRMRDIRGSNRMASIDRIAMLAALNLAHEYQQLANVAKERDQALSQTLGSINRQLDGLFDNAR